MEGQDNRRNLGEGNSQHPTNSSNYNNSNYNPMYPPPRPIYNEPNYPYYYSSNIKPEAYYQPNAYQPYQPYPAYNYYQSFRPQQAEIRHPNNYIHQVDTRKSNFKPQFENRQQNFNTSSNHQQTEDVAKSVTENLELNNKPKAAENFQLKLSSAFLSLRNDLNIDMKDIHLANELMDNLINRCTHSDMMNMKNWILNINNTNSNLDEECIRVDQFYHFLATFILELDSFRKKLMILYLINDLLFHELKYDLSWIKRDLSRFIPYLVYHTLTSLSSADPNQKDDLLKLFEIWDMNGFIKNEEAVQFKGYVERGIFTFKPPGIPQKVSLTNKKLLRYDAKEVVRPTAAELQAYNKLEAERKLTESAGTNSDTVQPRSSLPVSAQSAISNPAASLSVPPPPPPPIPISASNPTILTQNRPHQYQGMAPPPDFQQPAYNPGYSGYPPNYPSFQFPPHFQPNYNYQDPYPQQFPPANHFNHRLTNLPPPPPPPPSGGMRPRPDIRPSSMPIHTLTNPLTSRPAYLPQPPMQPATNPLTSHPAFPPPPPLNQMRPYSSSLGLRPDLPPPPPPSLAPPQPTSNSRLTSWPIYPPPPNIPPQVPLPLARPPINVRPTITPYHQVPAGVMVKLCQPTPNGSGKLTALLESYLPVDHKLAQHLPTIELPHSSKLLEAVDDYYSGLSQALNPSGNQGDWQEGYLDSWIQERKLVLKRKVESDEEVNGEEEEFSERIGKKTMRTSTQVNLSDVFQRDDELSSPDSYLPRFKG